VLHKNLNDISVYCIHNSTIVSQFSFCSVNVLYSGISSIVLQHNSQKNSIDLGYLLYVYAQLVGAAFVKESGDGCGFYVQQLGCPVLMFYCHYRIVCVN
jgi:hypothetical protein